jgi:hypothetical protein
MDVAKEEKRYIIVGQQGVATNMPEEKCVEFMSHKSTITTTAVAASIAAAATTTTPPIRTSTNVIFEPLNKKHFNDLNHTISSCAIFFNKKVYSVSIFWVRKMVRIFPR